MDLSSQLTPGRPITVYLINNRVHRGQVQLVGDGWLILSGQPVRLINLDQVVEILLEDVATEEAEVPGALPKPRSKDTPAKVSPKAPARPWSEDDLRALAHEFIDGINDTVLAERFHRSRSQITTLRQGFECARGNLTDDGISPVAQTWVARWRKVLAG